MSFLGLEKLFPSIFSLGFNSYVKISLSRSILSAFDNYFKNSSREIGQICIFLSNIEKSLILPLLDLEEIFLFIFHRKVTDNIYNIYSGQLSVLPITILKKSSQEIVKFASLFLYGYTKTNSNELKF